jgi:hypothetical protein
LQKEPPYLALGFVENLLIAIFNSTIFNNCIISVSFRIAVKERAACGGWSHCYLFAHAYL